MKVDDFFAFVLPDVPGCPDPTLRQAIVMAAVDFCRDSMSWSEYLDPIALRDGVQDYDLDAPSQAYVHLVRDVYLGARRLRPVTMAQLQVELPDWRNTSGNEPSYYNTSADRNALRVFPMPANTTGQQLVVRACFMPKPTATLLPDFLGQRFMGVIADGAKSRLMLMSGKPWTNEKLGIDLRNKFADGVTEARINETHDRVQGSIRATPRPFGY